MFKKDKFTLVSEHIIRFDEKIPQKLNFNHYLRNNNALILNLKHKVTNVNIIIANTHLFWNPYNEEIKLLQTAVLLEYLTNNYKNSDNVFLCGDFNSMPTSNIVHYICEKKEPLVNRTEIKF